MVPFCVDLINLFLKIKMGHCSDFTLHVSQKGIYLKYSYDTTLFYARKNHFYYITDGKNNKSKSMQMQKWC